MELTEKQILKISSAITISEIKSYINSHIEEYKKFLKNYNK